MSALDFAARAKALEARVIAEGVSGTAEAARVLATKASGTAADAIAATDLVRETLDASRKEVEAVSAVAAAAGSAATAAERAAQKADQLAREAAAGAPRLFGDLATARLPSSVNRIDSSGHGRAGSGGAAYICDDRATAQLAAAHPLACFKGDGDRHFRLLPDTQGYITPEQLGCPAYAPGVNQQPWMQAAINYAEAMGLKGVVFPERRYELWMPERLTAEGVGDTGHSGCGLVIRLPLSLISMHPLGTQFNYKGRFGGSLQTEYQVFNGTAWGDNVIWRGHGIKYASSVKHRPGYAASYDVLPSSIIRGITLHTDCRPDPTMPVTDRLRWPARTNVANGNTWDVNNKGICVQQGMQSGILVLEDVGIIGFLGELIYSGVAWANEGPATGLIARNLTLKHSNGQALNFNGPHIFDVDGLRVEDCAVTFEGWMGWEIGRIVRAYFKDCPTGHIAGGNIWMANLRPDGSMPLAEIDATFDNCGNQLVGSFVRGTMRCIDTKIRAVQSGSNATPIRNIDLKIISTCHRGNLSGALDFYGPSTLPQNVRGCSFDIELRRSAEATEKGFFITYAVGLSGSYGPGNEIRIRGDGDGALVQANGITDRRVRIAYEGPLPSVSRYVAFDITTTPTPEFQLPFLRPTFAGQTAGQFVLTPPNVGDYPDGHEVSIIHPDVNNANITIMVDNRAVIGARGQVRLRCNRTMGRWDIVHPPKPLRATASLQVSALALGAETPLVIPLMGCRPNLKAEVLAPGAGFANLGLGITAVRPETDQVRFWVRNLDGANPVSMSTAGVFTALVSGPEVGVFG